MPIQVNADIVVTFIFMAGAGTARTLMRRL
jgi:hypothetical protein